MGMRYVSLFSGVEAASVAWEPLGWDPVAFCEVDEFPSAVLAERFPDVPNLGDVTEIDWKEFHARFGSVDVLVGGSPCQSFSIAGNREGLSGESGLMFEYIRAVRELVQASGGGSPRYILWENVPGALSSERGVAFGQLLAELDELGYGLAWRVLDAQYVRVPDRSASGFFGPVAQRRRRVFLVGVLGSPHAAEILFERESLRWNHPKGREARQALAEHLEGCAGMGDSAGFKYHQGSGAGNIGYGEVSPTLATDYHAPAVLTPWDVQSKRVYSEEGTAPSLQSGTGEGMNIQPVILARTATGGGTAPMAAPTPSTASTGSRSLTNRGGFDAVAFAQNTRDEVRLFGGDGQTVGALAAQPGMKQTSYVCMQDGQSNGTIAEDGTSTTLNASHEQPIICAADDNGKTAIEEDMCGSLKVGGGSP